MENWKILIHLFITVFLSYFASLLVNPTIADVTMEAVCPGKDECSLAIYLSGFQQASFTAMVSEGGIICLSLSYVADNVSAEKRVSAFGLLGGVVSAATVCGTLVARLLPTARIFQEAAITAIMAAVYMRIFLKETARHVDALEEPILKPVSETNQVESKTHDITKDGLKKIPLPKDIIRLLKSSVTVSLVSFVAFFNSLAEAGIQAFLMYYLKARFHFQKDQFADICLITYIGATISNMVLMPILGPLLGEETLLCVGLFAGFLNMLLDSIAWSSWVPYASALLGIFLFLASPSIRCIISKQVGPYEQGIAQGCLMGITSFANVISPVIYSPLSALFLSEDAPFNFPGFSIMCVGLAWLVGFTISTMIKIIPLLSSDRSGHQHCTLA